MAFTLLIRVTMFDNYLYVFYKFYKYIYIMYVCSYRQTYFSLYNNICAYKSCVYVYIHENINLVFTKIINNQHKFFLY